MIIKRDGVTVYNSIDNGGTSDYSALGARTTKGRLDTLEGRFDNYYTKAETLDVMVGGAKTHKVAALPSTPEANTYYLVGNDVDGYTLHYYDSDLEYCYLGYPGIDPEDLSFQREHLPFPTSALDGRVYQLTTGESAGKWFRCEERSYYGWYMPRLEITDYTRREIPRGGDLLGQSDEEADTMERWVVTAAESGGSLVDNRGDTWVRREQADYTNYDWVPLDHSNYLHGVGSGTRLGYFNTQTRVSTYTYLDEIKKWLVNEMYPVGALYITTRITNPGVTLQVGTWEIVATDRVLWGVAQGTAAGTELDQQLPNVSGVVPLAVVEESYSNGALSVTKDNDGPAREASATGTGSTGTLTFNASQGNSTYVSNGKVRPKAYTAYIWKRTA